MRKRAGILTILTAVLLMFTGISAFGLPLAAPDKAERAVVTSEDADEWIRVLLGDHPEELEVPPESVRFEQGVEYHVPKIHEQQKK